MEQGGFKYLGIFLSPDHSQKNLVQSVELVQARPEMWRWLLPTITNRGRVLLISSALWHKLRCVDPLSLLLSTVQSTMVDFFWDRLHWVLQPVEELLPGCSSSSSWLGAQKSWCGGRLLCISWRDSFSSSLSTD